MAGSFVTMGHIGVDAGMVLYPASRGPMTPMHGSVFAKQRLASDAIGIFTLELRNVVVGSRYRVEVQTTGALVAEGVAASSTISLAGLPLYVGGSAGNDLRVKVRKGTAAPKYKPFEILAVAAAGTVISYVSQEPDPIA
jgi:hypothetical protein